MPANGNVYPASPEQITETRERLPAALGRSAIVNHEPPRESTTAHGLDLVNGAVRPVEGNVHGITLDDILPPAETA